MDKVISGKQRDALIELFTNVAGMDVLNRLDALTVIEILEQACRRAKVEMEEGMMKALIEGEGDSE